MGIDRRSILKAGIGTLAAATLPSLVRASSDTVEIQRLNDRLTVVSGVGCNVLALSGPDGLTLVDCGAAAHVSALQKHLRDLPGGKKVQTVFNTHWHPDQTGANEVFGKAGAQIIAHEKTRLWIATDHWVPAEERYEKARPKAAHPTRTFYTNDNLTVGTERIEYGYLLEAHTDGDCYVFCRDSNVLAVGHAASPVRDPELDWFGGGWIGGRLDALALLIKLSDDQTRVVPAFGPVIGRARLKAEFDLLKQVYDRSVTYVSKAFNYKDMLQAGVLEGLPRTWNDPQAFMYSVCKGLWAHHNMLVHEIV
jgi:glyoxylase-like metal-dependent hydrolase (beta-lactamase superfamily II)